MAKTYKILVNDGKGTDIKPVSVEQGVGAKGEPVHLVAKRGWRFQLQDELKGKGLAPDQVRLKRVGKDLAILFDGSQRADVVIEDYYAENTDKDKDNGMPTLVGNAENGGMYEYVPQDPAISSMPAELKDGNTPVIVSLGGGPLGDDFVLSALPLVAAAGGMSGWLVAGGVAAAAAAGGGGGGGGSGAAVVVVPAKATGSLTHDATNDTGVSDKDSITNNKTPVLTINAEHGAKVVVTVNGKEYTATETSTAGVYTVPVTDELKDGTYTPTIKVTNSAGSTTSDGTPFTVDLSTFTDPYPTDPFNPPVINKSGLRVTIDTDANNDGLISNSELPSSKLVTATVALTKDAVAGDVLTVAATGNTTRNITLNQANIDAHKYVLTDLIAPTDGNTITVSASIKDAAGNASPTPDAKDVAKVDSKALGVTITTDANNDGYINAAELGIATTVNVKVDVPVNAKTGDTVVVTDGNSSISHVLTADEVAAKNFTLVNAFGVPAEGGTITVTATFVGVSTADSAKLDTSKFIDPINPLNPTDPTMSGLRVTIDTDANNDGVISNAELLSSKLVTATVALTKDTAVGDVLTVAATGNTTRIITLTQSDIDAHKYVLTDLMAPADGSSISVSASIKDVAGNASPTPDASDLAKVDSTVPSVTITTDVNNDGYINKAELGSATQVSVKVDVPANATTGDTVVVTDGKLSIRHVLTAGEVTAKNFTLANAFNAPAEGETITVTASFGSASASDKAKIDTAESSNASVNLHLSITTDTNDDGFVNAAELGSAQTFTSRVTFDPAKVVEGDMIALTATNVNVPLTNITHVLNATDVKNGFVDVMFAKPNVETIQTVTANFVDAAGNAATDAKPTDSAKLDVTAPNNKDIDLSVQIMTDAGPGQGGDGVVNAAELNGASDFTSRATFTGSKATLGYKIVFTATNGNAVLSTQIITLQQTDLNLGYVEVAFQKPAADGVTQTVTAMYADSAGNSAINNAPTDFAKLDVSAPNEGVAPVVKIATDGANGGVADGWLNNIEIEAGNTAFKSADAKVTITASFDKTKVTVGDTVVFKVGASTQEVLLDTQAKVDIGIVSIQVDAPQKGQAITATALIKDSVSNSTLESAAVTATRNSLDAVEDTASISAANTTISGNVVNNDLDPQYLADHKNQNTSSDNLEVAVDAVKKGTSAGFAVADQLFTNGGTVQGDYGTLNLKSDGSYVYVLNNDAKTHALAAGETAQELFTYEVVDDAGNVSMAKLTVTITGVNDMAILTVKETKYNLNNSQRDSGLWNSILSITDADTGEGYLNGINHDVAGSYQTSKINLHYGDLNLTQVGGGTTSPIYDLQYFKNNLGLTSSTDTARHDLYVLNSADGTATETLDFEIDPTGTIKSHEYHTSSTVGLKIASASPTTFDTLLLDVSGNTFDFTGLAATTNIKSIEKVDISGSGNNTIKLSLDSLTQADAVNNVHQLFIDGNAGDQVQLVNGNQAVKADTNSVTGYDRYVVDLTHELLIQHVITISFIS